MAEASYDLFISYRRENGSAEARLLRERLIQGGWRVFLDVADLKKGFFDEALLGYIASSRNFLVVLSPRALDRCASEQDWLRREIEQAISTDRNIIPVMLPGFQWPGDLPPSIASLPRHQGLDYSHVYFDAMIARIDESMRLERDEAEKAGRERERERKEREDREREMKRREQPVPPKPSRWPLALAGAVALLALIAGYYWQRQSSEQAAFAMAIREGRTHLMTKQWDAALREFGKVPSSNAEYKDALRGQVEALRGARRWDAAASAMRRLVALEPDNAALRFELGAILRERGDDAGALVALRQAADSDPGNPAYRDAIREVEQKLNPPAPEPAKPAEEPKPIRFSDAIQPVENKPRESKSKAWQLVHGPKESDEAVVNRAKALAREGKLDEAEREMRRALTISPNQISYRFMRRDLAEILDKKGDLDGALREMAIAVKLWPKDAWYEYNYHGRLLEKKGDLEAALAQYKIAAQAPAYQGDYDRLRRKMGR